jgi:hypothetical protein
VHPLQRGSNVILCSNKPQGLGLRSRRLKLSEPTVPRPAGVTPSERVAKMSNSSERVQILLDQAASGQLSRRRFLTAVSTAGLAAGLSGAAVEHALAAGENQAFNQAQLKGAYDYIVVGGGASGSIIAGELSKTGARYFSSNRAARTTAPPSVIRVSGSTMSAARWTGICQLRRSLI